MDLDETLAELHRLDHLEGEASFTDCMRDMDQLMLDTLKQMDARVANNRDGNGIPAGLADLDRLTAGWQRGELVIVPPALPSRKDRFRSAPGIGGGACWVHVVVYSIGDDGRTAGRPLSVCWATDLSATICVPVNSLPTSSNRHSMPPGELAKASHSCGRQSKRVWIISALRHAC